MVGMLDYHLHYALLAAGDRLLDAGRRRGRSQPIRPHRRIFVRGRREDHRR